jgi:hypothetical protein
MYILHTHTNIYVYIYTDKNILMSLKRNEKDEEDEEEDEEDLKQEFKACCAQYSL